jgi:CRP/FNR family transcriptional regulator, cyclic AMP receptor protein
MTDDLVDFALLSHNGIPARELKTGEIIFREGDPATEMYLIEKGSIEIRLGNRLLGTLGPDSIFGEMALIDSSARSATAVAATDATIIPVSEYQFLFLVSNAPRFALKVMRVLVERLRSANKLI